MFFYWSFFKANLTILLFHYVTVVLQPMFYLLYGTPCSILSVISLEKLLFLLLFYLAWYVRYIRCVFHYFIISKIMWLWYSGNDMVYIELLYWYTCGSINNRSEHYYYIWLNYKSQSRYQMNSRLIPKRVGSYCCLNKKSWTITMRHCMSN